MVANIQKHANRIARKYGYSRADEIIYGEVDKVVDHIHYGYRKYTTGEYVSPAYRRNFGWKNTYYESAYTVVMIRVF